MASIEKLTIETPEHTALEFPLAGIGSRFLALAIDTLLQIGVSAVLGTGAAIVASTGILKQMGTQWGIAILIFAFFVVEVGYFSFFEAVWNGQTPGKRWTHLRVIRDSGQPIGVQDAILRNLLRIVDALPSLYATGVITILISPQNKRVGDYAAGTVVVHEKPLQGAGLMWNTSTTQPMAASQIPVITIEELQLVEAFLARRESFAPDVRWSMARQIADRLGQRRSVPLEARPDSEKFLEALAEQCRNAARFR
jgi:uncharacterized RDD family membrane protein YckC